jgi:hypothetical protein
LSLLVAPGVPGRILSAVFDATPVIETDPRMLPDSNGHFPVLDNSVGMVETDPSNGTAPPPDPALLAESPKAPAKKRPVGGLSFSLDVTVDTLVLNMVSGGAILTLSVSPGQEWNGEAHTVRIECIPDPEGMRVSMTLDGIVRDTDSVSLPASLSGSGHFELGGSSPATQVDSTTVIETDPAIEPESSDLALPGSPTQTAGRNVIDDVALERIVVKPVPVVTPLSEEKSESL